MVANLFHSIIANSRPVRKLRICGLDKPPPGSWGMEAGGGGRLMGDYLEPARRPYSCEGLLECEKDVRCQHQWRQPFSSM